jgi:hypothetical protein
MSQFHSHARLGAKTVAESVEIFTLAASSPRIQQLSNLHSGLHGLFLQIFQGGLFDGFLGICRAAGEKRKSKLKN